MRNHRETAAAAGPVSGPTKETSREPIAIIGIGCRFPGGIDGPAAFWRALRDELDAIGEIPADRFDSDALYDPTPRTPGKIMSRWGGYLDRIDGLDAGFFGISPREADRLDPQQRLLLEVAWEALEDGGQPLSALAGSRTGVFVGLWLNDYEARLFADPAVDFYMTTGTGRYSAAGRLSYAFGFQGPSIAIDTACSSSLVAVHLACRSLWSGECSLALAGGANVILQPHITIAYSQSGMMAPDGRCKFGDARGNGYVRSEGAGVVLLKPLSRALADGDPVYAVILGGAVNNDGQSGDHMTTPAQAGQEEMLRLALEDAGVEPAAVHYVEAHGTGTAAGDPVEIGALGEVLGRGRPADRPLLIGSVKTNFGHTEGAAGVAGLIKVALLLRSGEVPRSLHFEQPNPAIDWDGLRVRIAGERVGLPAGERWIAGVSSFGIAGTNAHLLLGAWPRPEGAAGGPAGSSDGAAAVATAGASASGGAVLVPLSAASDAALTARARDLAAWLEAGGRDDGGSSEAPALEDVAYTLGCRRTHLERRLAVVARDAVELTAALAAYGAGEAHPAVVSAEPVESPGKIVFVFPGQGSQWVGMGRELLEREPVFRESVDACEAAMRPYVDWSLVEQLRLDPASPGYRLNDIDVIQPVLVSLDIALAALWRSWGVEPSAVIGHSMGEVAAAYVAGALSLDDAMRIICRRSQLLRRTSGRGAMAVVELSVEEAESALVGREDRLSIAVSNSPRSTVISGDPAALDEVLAELERRDVFCRRVNVDVASHSPQMDPLLPELRLVLDGLQPRTGTLPVYSTAIGEVLDGSTMDEDYWLKNLRQPVLFSAMVQRLAAEGHYTFVEVSPHPVLLPAIEQGLRHAGLTGVTVASLRREEPERETMLAGLGRLYTVGHSVDWGLQHPGGGRLVPLPAYPWQRERYWLEVRAGRAGARSMPGGHPLLGQRLPSAAGAHHWEADLDAASLPYLTDHRVRGAVVFPAAGFLEMAHAAAVQAFGAGGHVVDEVAFSEALVFEDGAPRTVQVALTPDTGDASTFRIYSCRADADADEPWLLHASGTILRDRQPAAPGAAALDALRAGGGAAGAEHYRAAAARGLEYGPAFQGVAEYWAKDGEVLARVRAPEAVAAGARTYRLHPALLDACLQVALDTAGAEIGADEALLPVAVGALHVYEAPDPEAELWVHARRVDGQGGGAAAEATSADELAAELRVMDAAGKVLVAVRGFRLRRVAREQGDAADGRLYEVRWVPAGAPAAAAEPRELAGRWLVLADRGGVGERLAARLADSGADVAPILADAAVDGAGQGVDPMRPESVRAAVEAALADGAEPRGVIHLWGLDGDVAGSGSPAAATERGALGVLHLVQALAAAGLDSPPRLWLVTRGAQAVRGEAEIALDQAPLWGLAAVIGNEHPEVRCSCVDLDPGSTGAEADVAALLAELVSGGTEDRIALRGGERLAARLVRASLEGDGGSQAATPSASPDQPFALEAVTPGRLDGLALRAVQRRSPGPGEVEIEVAATGLNFLDVMKALGVYPGLDPDAPVALGAECAGRVTAVGAGVEGLREGDEVVAISPSLETTSLFASHVTIPAALALKRPAGLTAEQAAGVPIAFLTAQYALSHIARLSAGERVLIHSATGGVGLAAIQLARLAGAEIFATAGSPEKRAYLERLGIQHVMDSRTLDFAAEVLERTGGEGVDVVLNSLAGAAIAKGLSVLRPFGRFVEIGKRDIYDSSRLGLDPFRRNLTFSAVDLAAAIRQRPAPIMAMLREILALVEEGRLEPLPTRAFPIAEAADAFRFMAQGQHIGKIVTIRGDGAPPVLAREAAVGVRPDGTYLVTGGLGALGLLVAERLAAHGARHLVLLGRREPDGPARDRITALERGGVRVVAMQADVARADEMAAVFARIDAELPPLAGVVHAAGVLADGTLAEMDRERFGLALAPKVAGAWNLHELTTGRPLDHFVLFSSVATVLGNPGQANYATANAFLDGLAQHRRARGEAALSIAWGPWASVGLAAADARRGQRLAERGLGSLTPEEGLAALDRLLGADRGHVAVMPFELPRWGDHHPRGGSPFFDELRAGGEAEAAETAEPAIRDALAAAEPGRQRRAMLEAYLRDQVAGVLRLAPARIAVNRPFKALGMDSLMALELRNRLEAGLGVTLSATMVWNHPTIAQLAPFLAGRMGIELEAPAGGGARAGETNGTAAARDPAASVPAPVPAGERPAASAGAVTADLADEELSREEIEALLDEELAAVDDLLKGSSGG